MHIPFLHETCFYLIATHVEYRTEGLNDDGAIKKVWISR